MDPRIISKFISLARSQGIVFELSNDLGSNYKVVPYNLRKMIAFITLIDGNISISGTGQAFAASVSVDVIHGIQGRITGSITPTGSATLETLGYSIFMNEGIMSFPTYADARQAFNSNQVEISI